MLDGYMKSTIDKFWNAAAIPLARTGITPNQVTGIGLALILANCALYLHHQSSLWFGLGLAIAFAFDALDGAVARLQGSASKYGGYFDAVIDRYQEIAVYGAIAWVNGWWAAVFFALTGSLLTSYNKARAAIEIPINNEKWPDLLERTERIIVLCLVLILDSAFTLPIAAAPRVLYVALWAIALLTHFTAIQRFFRARRLLLDHAASR